MSERSNGPEDSQQVGPQTMSMVDLVIDWRRAFRLPGVASMEMMMRISMQQMQRQLTHLRAAGETLTAVGAVNAKFIQRISSEAASDWHKTIEAAAKFRDGATQHRAWARPPVPPAPYAGADTNASP